MEDRRGTEARRRIESLLVRAQELRARVARRERDASPRGVEAAQEAADSALAAAGAALWYASEAHARAAKAHREFAAVLERTGYDERAKRQWEAAAADEEAAAFDLRQMVARGGEPPADLEA